MTKIEFETHLRMVKAMLDSKNYELLKQVIDESLKSSAKDNKKAAKNQKKNNAI